MSLVRICDICGEICPPQMELREYRTQKMKRVWRGHLELPAQSWEEVDICDDCHKMLRKVIKQRKMRDMVDVDFDFEIEDLGDPFEDILNNN